jgi:alpha-tubulin suppressor-like RCC1 family protein
LILAIVIFSIDVTAVACGKKHVVVVGSEGEVFSWGCGADGRLGMYTICIRCMYLFVDFFNISILQK